MIEIVITTTSNRLEESAPKIDDTHKMWNDEPLFVNTNYKDVNTPYSFFYVASLYRGSIADSLTSIAILKATCYFGYFKEAFKFCEEAEQRGKRVVRLSFAGLSCLVCLSYSHLELYIAALVASGIARQYKKCSSPDAATLVTILSAVESILIASSTRRKGEAEFSWACTCSHGRKGKSLFGRFVGRMRFDFAKRDFQEGARVFLIALWISTKTGDCWIGGTQSERRRRAMDSNTHWRFDSLQWIVEEVSRSLVIESREESISSLHMPRAVLL